MSDEGQAIGVAVVGEEGGPETPAVERILRQWHGCDARWYLRHDLDMVDEAVRGDQLRCVVFAAVNDLLEEMWEGEVEIDGWLAKGVRVEFAQGLGPNAAAQAEALLRSWRGWKGGRRRRRVAAGALLSVLAVAAAFAVNWAAG